MSISRRSRDQAEIRHKVFLTDEVETHALSGVDLEIAKGEYVVDRRPSGCGKSTLLSILGLLDSADERRVLAERPGRWRVAAAGSRPRPQPRDRIHFSELQSHRRSDGVRERRAAAHLSRRCRRRAARARRPRRSNASAWRTAPNTCRASSPAASSSASPLRGPSPASPPCCSPTSPRATSIRRAASRSWSCCTSCTERRDDLHGDARSALRPSRATQYPPVRRAGRRAARSKWWRAESWTASCRTCASRPADGQRSLVHAGGDCRARSRHRRQQRRVHPRQRGPVAGPALRRARSRS